MNDQINAIVLSVKEYREYDLMMKVLAEDGTMLHLVARGVRKIKSKNASACLPFTYARIQLNDAQRRSLHTLRYAEIIESYRKIREDLLKQSIASYVCECIEKSDYEENVFSLLKFTMDTLQETTHPFRILCLFQAIMNRMHGIEPFVDGCVRCGRADGIYAISLRDGGFVCKQCYRIEEDMQKTKLDLKCFRLLCKADIKHYELLKQYPDFSFANFEDLFYFFQEYAGVSLKSIRFLRSLQALD